MKLLIIRHADPDYTIDSLTPKGWKEAALLAERMTQTKVDTFYMSPLGRAKDTASITLQKRNQTATILPWLREFKAPIHDEETGTSRIPWDWLPEKWTQQPTFYDKDHWADVPVMSQGKVLEEAKLVQQGIDTLLNHHGYTRNGNIYHAETPNEDTLVLFCHFGVECVILGHLLGISPMVLWHGTCAVPSSVTTLVTEERRKGIASFRMTTFGDTTHLYLAHEEPAFAGRFCEMYDNLDQRHD